MNGLVFMEGLSRNGKGAETAAGDAKRGEAALFILKDFVVRRHVELRVGPDANTRFTCCHHAVVRIFTFSQCPMITGGWPFRQTG